MDKKEYQKNYYIRTVKNNPEAKKLRYEKNKIYKKTDKYKPIQKRCNESLNGKYRSLKFAAKRKNMILELSKEEYAILINSNCIYCSGPLNKSGYGLDRISNEKGYTKGNLVPCCDICNTAKNCMEQKEFFKWIENVYNNISKVPVPT